MEELKKMVTRLRKALTEKETEIAEKEEAFTSTIYSRLGNRKNEIDVFEQSAGMINASIVEKAKVIANFEKDARRIEASIAQIGN
ncbi:hypothetical protein AB6735_08225 [Mucilaginibacter sp. RCC_168]|uniref:hypothetical protein n=1 Tax=Mucilaginibacter sp. RCC_168 TaxID=3239221 RepID=UPI003524F832